MSKFNIGQAVWRASWDYSKKWITCPDCGGTKTLTAILWDKTEYIIECVGCAAGYEPPRGVVSTGTFSATTHLETVRGVEIANDGTFQYRTSGDSAVNEAELFATHEEALTRASEITAEKQKEEEAKIYQKDKPARSWSWHVHYHRRSVKEAQKALEYHTAKLNAAKVKVKEPEAEAATTD